MEHLIFETIWLGICGVLSYRLVRDLEHSDKQLNHWVYVRSEFTDFEGWVRIDE